MSQTRVLIASLLALFLLVGCGKRGPLYMPGESTSQQKTSAPAQVEPAADTPAE